MRKKLLINLSLVEIVEYLQLEDGRINVKLVMISGREINNFYDNEELADNHYLGIKKAICTSIETFNDN